MSRNLKALGLAMVAVFALSAVAASAAQGAKHHISVASAPAIITAEDTVNTVFSITEGSATKKVTCTTTLYEGTIAASPATETTVTPTYSGCEFASFPATVTVNHCAYILKGETDANEHATAGVECAEGNDITIVATVFGATCTTHVYPQSPAGGVHYTQEGNNISIKATLTGITYHETHDSFVCPSDHTGHDGTLSGTVLAKGFKEKVCSALTGTEKTTPGSHYTNCEGESQKLTLGST